MRFPPISVDEQQLEACSWVFDERRVSEQDPKVDWEKGEEEEIEVGPR